MASRLQDSPEEVFSREDELLLCLNMNERSGYVDSSGGANRQRRPGDEIIRCLDLVGSARFAGQLEMGGAG